MHMPVMGAAFIVFTHIFLVPCKRVKVLLCQSLNTIQTDSYAVRFTNTQQLDKMMVPSLLHLSLVAAVSSSDVVLKPFISEVSVVEFQHLTLLTKSFRFVLPTSSARYGRRVAAHYYSNHYNSTHYDSTHYDSFPYISARMIDRKGTKKLSCGYFCITLC